MLGYFQADLLKFQSEATTKPQDAPHRWNQPIHGAKTHYYDTDNAELVDAKSTMYVKRLCGKFLYYAKSVDRTMLVALSAIATAQSHTTTTTMGALFDY